MSVKIYGLLDPRIPLIRYVGKTTQSLLNRRNGHIHKARSGRCKTPCGEWIRHLLYEDVKPDIILLKHVAGNGAKEERYWIAQLSNLLNVCPGGNGAYSRAPFPEQYKSLLGIISDQRLGEMCGMSRENVKYHRNSLSISRAHDRSRASKPPQTVNKYILTDEQLSLLGKVPDKDIASVVGMTKQAVRYRRNSLGIPAFTGKPRRIGSNHHGAKITELIAHQIKSRLAQHSGRIPRGKTTELAREFGVSIHIISAIHTGLAWNHINL